MEILRNLIVNFGDKCILKNVTIESDKNIIHIIGPNGVGKTTLCNAIIGNHSKENVVLKLIMLE